MKSSREVAKAIDRIMEYAIRHPIDEKLRKFDLKVMFDYIIQNHVRLVTVADYDKLVEDLSKLTRG